MAPTWTVSEADFEELRTWGLEKDPFAAVKDFSELKKELRWLNPEHRQLFVDYMYRRFNYIGSKNFDEYYKKVDMTIDRDRWRFLKDRKAWYITPLGWENCTKHDCTIADLGCGDGDTVQRLVDYIDAEWKKQGVTSRKVHIVGIELNPSRAENGRNLVRSPNANITVEFQVGNVVGDGLKFGDRSFDYSLCTGVLEILEDKPCETFMDEMCRVTKKGVYIEDLFERFPGGYPRENLPQLFEARQFNVTKHIVVLSEPFDVARSRDPKKLWPVMLDQNLWAERV